MQDTSEVELLYDTESLPKQQGQEINATRLHLSPVQGSIEAYGNLLVGPFVVSTTRF